MGDLTTKEKLHPSLLDRLRDDNPKDSKEGRNDRVIDFKKLRKYVLRDLTWLLNTTQLSSYYNFYHYPFVNHSIINYGVPNLSGVLIENKNPKMIEAKIKQAIMIYEPRIEPTSLSVKMTVNNDVMSSRTVFFEIQGLLWGQPIPTELYLKTEVDIESGGVSIVEN